MAKCADCVLLVFAKAPLAGAVKTRLCPPLADQQAAELHQRLIWHTLESASSAAIGPIELWCTPSIHEPFFAQCGAHFQLELRTQGSGDLGDKMQAALYDALNRAKRAILIGSDCPTITPEYLRQANATLDSNHDIVLGPAEDGGYGLIGAVGKVPDIFSGIPWGSALVMKATLGRLSDIGSQWCELPTIWDVDRPADLRRLANDPQLSHLMKGFAPDRVVV
jgi:uncharacterized protein